MLVIPVIDLMGGRVVHARRGDRSNYRPLRSTLTASSDAMDVVVALLEAAPFPVLYAADLDAILRRGDHRELIQRIEQRFVSLTIWADAGFGEAANMLPWLGSGRIVPVIGSESLTSGEALAGMLTAAPDAVLSLDTRDDQPLGPPALFDQPEQWPLRVIVMTLDRVGAGRGPALNRLRDTVAKAPGKQVIAAGGIRDTHDLEALEAMGVHAVLVASAIHDGTLKRATLARYASG